MQSKGCKTEKLQAINKTKVNFYRGLTSAISITQCFGMLWSGRTYSHAIPCNISCFHVQFLMYNSKYTREVEGGRFQTGVVRLTDPCCVDRRCVTTTGTATATRDGRLRSATGQATAAASTVVQLTSVGHCSWPSFCPQGLRK